MKKKQKTSRSMDSEKFSPPARVCMTARGVEFLAENGGHGFEKQYDARYFQAARSRSAAAADEHEYEQYDLGKWGHASKS